jgi:O-acetyl-ADP-ribose deacetylase (regulator of RNase III)
MRAAALLRPLCLLLLLAGRAACAEAHEMCDAMEDAGAAAEQPQPQACASPAAPDEPAAPAVGAPWRGVTPRRIDALPGGALLVCSQGSVVPFAGDAIVNAANTGCLGGGGVDGAINDAGGWKLEDARYALPVVRRGVRCPTGDARITIGGDLAASWVIHAVGPDFRSFDSDEEADELLASAYAASMRLAQEKQLRSVAFSLISASIFRGHRKLSDVLGIAVRSLRAHAYPGLQEVHLVAFTPVELRGLLNAAAAAAEAPEAAEAAEAAPTAAAGAAAAPEAAAAEAAPAAAAGVAAAPEAAAAESLQAVPAEAPSGECAPADAEPQPAA